MEKFNLERALAGDPVITRDGQEVTQLVKLDGVKHNENVVGVFDGEIHFWTIEGKFDNRLKETPFDLFMKPKENAIWVNVYKDHNGKLFAGCSYDSEKEAKEATGSYPKIRTIKIVE